MRRSLIRRSAFAASILSGIAIAFALLGGSQGVRPAQAESVMPAAHPLDAFAEARLRDAILLYDRHLRVPATGQYLDAIRIGAREQSGASSIASTGMGLISLALGDALGIVADAEAKAEVTLAHLLNEGGQRGFAVERSPSGWYRHWFDPLTGRTAEGSREKYSTIDTAILGAGAAILASHLREKARAEGRAIPRAALLADRLVGSVSWSQAIRNADRGSIHLVFFGAEERPSPRVATIPFDEYALLPCMAASHERALRVQGPASKAWRTRFQAAEDLPMLEHDGLTLLGKPTGSVPSHFTHQFAFYLCGAYASDPAFLAELQELMTADRAWFAKAGVRRDLWGLGAGSEPVTRANGEPGQRYGVARLAKNPEATASPAIMAGFLAVDAAAGRRAILGDLRSLWDARRCRYAHQGLEFLWRCSGREPTQRVTRLEGIDFSTWMLGLATAHPKIGLGFFQRHAF